MADNNTPTRRTFLKITGAGAGTAAITNSFAKGVKATKPDKGADRTLDLWSENPIQSLDPIQTGTFEKNQRKIQNQIFDTLVTHPDGEPEIEKEIAAEYSISSDSTTYRFTLKKNVVFHDRSYGTVDANDVVYSFERLAASPHSEGSQYILQKLNVVHDRDDKDEYIPGTLGVRAVDDRTVEIELANPTHKALDILAHVSFAIIPEGIVDDVPGYDGDMTQKEFRDNPIGCGPFTLDAFSSRTVSVKRFPQYHGQSPFVKTIRWTTGKNPNKSRMDRIYSKDLDIFNVPNESFDPSKKTATAVDDSGREFGEYGPLRNGETLNYLSTAELTTIYIGMNTNSINKSARKALALVLNQNQVAERFYKGLAAPASHLTPPAIYPEGNSGYKSHEKAYPYGLSESKVAIARRTMEDAGYSSDNRYSYKLSLYDNSPRLQQLADQLKYRLEQAHIDLQIESLPFQKLVKQSSEGDLDAYTLGWVADWPAPENFLQLVYPPNTFGSETGLYWDGTSAAQTAKSAWKTIQSNPEPTEEADSNRADAIRTMTEAVWSDAVLIPFIHPLIRRYWYDWVELHPIGALGASQQQHEDTKVFPKKSKRNKNKNQNGH
jgi:ABC-type transport system substrate-binding protein